MVHPKDTSLEMLIRELGEILAGGFLRLRGSEANLPGRAPELEGQAGLTDDTANGCNSRNVPD
jgi:hypothetical protein